MRTFRIKKYFKIKYSFFDTYLYLVLIPFLYPRGFSEYNTNYKLFFTAWLYVAMFCIVTVFLQSVFRFIFKIKQYVAWMLIYHIMLILITLCVQKKIDIGLQKMIAAPTLSLFCVLCLENKAKVFIRCISNILIIVFSLNVTIFSPWLWTDLFDVSNHILFIGHVQIGAQLGILGLFISCLLYEQGNAYIKAKILFVLSIITMVISQTAASVVVLFFLVLFYFFRQFKIGKTLTGEVRRPSRLLLGLTVGNVLLLWLTKHIEGSFFLFGSNITLSGRFYIWQSALALMKDHWIFGYGVEGVMIKVFWHQWSNNGLGMNYAHNEFMQHLLDGGIFVLILFVLMLYSYIKNINNILNIRIKQAAIDLLICYLLIMAVECVTNFYYFFIFLSLVAYFGDLRPQQE